MISRWPDPVASCRGGADVMPNQTGGKQMHRPAASGSSCRGFQWIVLLATAACFSETPLFGRTKFIVAYENKDQTPFYRGTGAKPPEEQPGITCPSQT